MNATDLESLRNLLQGKDPRTILRAALDRFERIAVSFSGAEDVVLVEMASLVRPGIEVFCLDTGRLHPETYRLIETVRTRYPIRLQILMPDAGELEALVREKGLFSFLEEGHSECCGVRKVGPLRRKLATLDAWITGQRKDQALPRLELSEVERDEVFARPGETLVKFNPLCNWSSSQVWDHIEAYDVPYNALHERGYHSIGCEPCTRPIRPHQHEREGRWWWESESKKECGLHLSNLKN